MRLLIIGALIAGSVFAGFTLPKPLHLVCLLEISAYDIVLRTKKSHHKNPV
jgi:hypothetical protein